MSTPQNSSAASKEESREEHKPDVPRVVVAQVRCDVDGIAETSKRYRGLDAELVGYASTEKADYGKCSVEGAVGIVGSPRLRSKLASGTKAVHGVEHSFHFINSVQRHEMGLHTWAQETNESDQYQLGLRRSIVW